MVRIVEDVFGAAVNRITRQKEEIRRFTLSNDMQTSVQIITLGATITSIKTPDASGSVDDIVLGYDDVAGYQTPSNPYFGATIGRVCNRLALGRFILDGREIDVSRNLNNKHQLHGGFVSFDKVHWEVLSIDESGVSMQFCSPDGQEGYPGEVVATLHFVLTEDSCLHVRMEARTTQRTAINLTNHSYFNLAGHAAGPDAIFEHSILINANNLTQTDAESIPTGRLQAVEGTPYDLRKPVTLGAGLRKLLPTNGFDDNYCVELINNGTTVISKAFHSPSGRWLEIASNQPGVQFYTANSMPDEAKGEAPIIGKSGAKYVKHGAFCLETQKYPDAVHHPNFPSIILSPGELYSHEVIYKFGVCRSGGCSQ